MRKGYEMPTLDELEALERRGDAIARVAAERLKLDPAQIIEGTLTVEIDESGETVRWNGYVRMHKGFLEECIEEAMTREGDLPFTHLDDVVPPKGDCATCGGQGGSFSDGPCPDCNR